MDMKTRIADLWRRTCQKVSGFWVKIKDLFKKIPGLFHKKEEPFSDSFVEEVEVEAPVEQETAVPATPLQKTGRILKGICIWIYRLRRFIMAAPVIWYAVKLAKYNLQNLPEQVGLNLQANGEFAQMISRNSAVYGPLGITAACLLLMFFSRRARYPWVISIFTLVLPILILFTNLYPQ